MIRQTVLVLLLFVMALAKPGAPQDQTKEAGAPSADQGATITDSGSTNTPGYRLTVHASGSAEWSVSRRRNSPACSGNKGKLPPELTRRFFGDLNNLMPLDKLPAGHCAKSASFGTTLRVTYQGAISPDLTCPGDGAQTGNLLNDLSDINRALGINTGVPGLPQGCEQRPTAPNP